MRSLLSALAAGGLSLVLGTVLAPAEDPRPMLHDRYVDYWFEASAEGAVPVRLAIDRVEFRAYLPEPSFRFVCEERHSAADFELVVTNLNRDLVDPPEGTQGRWTGPTTYSARLVVRAESTVEFRFRLRRPGGASRFFVAADPELNFALLDRFLSRAREARPDFVLVLGDLVQEEPWYLDAYLRAFEKAEVPVYAVIGNNDLAGHRGLPPWEARKDEFHRVFGPRWRSFEFRGAQFVFLDTGSHGLGREQMAWFEETLRAGDPRPRLVFTHKPIFDPWGGEEHQLEDQPEKARLRTLMAATPGAVWYCGHIEGHFVFEAGGVPVRIAGSLTFEGDLHEEPEPGTNGYVDIRLEPGGVRVEERVPLAPSTRLETARVYARDILPLYVRSRPTVQVGLALLAAALVLALGRRLLRRRAPSS